MIVKQPRIDQSWNVHTSIHAVGFSGLSNLLCQFIGWWGRYTVWVCFYWRFLTMHRVGPAFLQCPSAFFSSTNKTWNGDTKWLWKKFLGGWWLAVLLTGMNPSRKELTALSMRWAWTQGLWTLVMMTIFIIGSIHYPIMKVSCVHARGTLSFLHGQFSNLTPMTEVKQNMRNNLTE